MCETTEPYSDFDCDDNSDVSSLQCGSIPPNAAYDPARDPRNFTFIPPVDIVVQGKVEVPQWLRIEWCDSPIHTATNVMSEPRHSNEDGLLRQVSWGSRISTQPEHVSSACLFSLGGDDWEQRSRRGSPDFCKGAKSTASTHRTSTTIISCDEDASVALLETGEADQPLMHRLSMFQRRKRRITLRRPRGCLT